MSVTADGKQTHVPFMIAITPAEAEDQKQRDALKREEKSKRIERCNALAAGITPPRQKSSE